MRTKVDLLAVGVGLESLGDTQNGLCQLLEKKATSVQSRDAEAGRRGRRNCQRTS